MHLTWLDPHNDNQPFPHPDRALTEPDGLLRRRQSDTAPSAARLSDGYLSVVLGRSADPVVVTGPTFGFAARMPQRFRAACARPSARGCSPSLRTPPSSRSSRPAPGRVRENRAPGSPRNVPRLLSTASAGHAHSIETWQQGASWWAALYGVSLGRVFYGESMFSWISDAFQIALVALATQLQRWEFAVIDCQVTTAHLLSMGAVDIPRSSFLQLLECYCPNQASPALGGWTPICSTPCFPARAMSNPAIRWYDLRMFLTTDYACSYFAGPAGAQPGRRSGGDRQPALHPTGGTRFRRSGEHVYRAALPRLHGLSVAARSGGAVSTEPLAAAVVEPQSGSAGAGAASRIRWRTLRAVRPLHQDPSCRRRHGPRQPGELLVVRSLTLVLDLAVRIPASTGNCWRWRWWTGWTRACQRFYTFFDPLHKARGLRNLRNPVANRRGAATGFTVGLSGLLDRAVWQNGLQGPLQSRTRFSSRNAGVDDDG